MKKMHKRCERGGHEVDQEWIDQIDKIYLQTFLIFQFTTKPSMENK